MRTIAIAIGLGAASLLATTPASAAENWRHFTKSEGLPGDRVQFLQEDVDGAIWIGTLSGLARYADGEIEKTPVKSQSWDVLRRGEDAYWVGTNKGVVAVDGGESSRHLKAFSVTHFAPLADDGVAALAKNRNTEKSFLVAYSGGEWKKVESVKKEHVNGLLRRSNGAVWATIEGKGVVVLDPADGWSVQEQYLDGENVTTLAEDADGRVWCGLWQRGLAVFQKGEWSRHLRDQRVYVYTIAETPDGEMWVATDQAGLWRRNGGEWVNDLHEEGGVNMLSVTSDGRVWVSTQAKGGLRYWNGDEWVTALRGPLPIRDLLETEDGRLFAGGVLSGLYVWKSTIPD